MDIEIRSYWNSDYPQVKEILEKSNLYWEYSDNKKALSIKIQKYPDSILVAIVDGNVVGTQFIISDFMSFMFRLAVHPLYREKGIESALMKRGEEILKHKGYNHVNILVAVEDKALQSTYEKQGYEKGNNYIWMTKELKK